jgi:hypothetical protein
MSNNDNFDPKMYPELFTDDDMNPVEMAMLMQAIYGSEPEKTDTTEQTDKPKDTHTESLFAPNPQSESLFSQTPPSVTNNNPMELLSSILAPNANGEIEISEEQIMNNPMLFQMLMQTMATNPSMFSDIEDDDPNQEYSNNEEYQFMDTNIEPINLSNLEGKIVNTETNKEEKNTELIENIKDEIIIEHLKHKKSNKCNLVECKSKLGMFGFDCKCGYKFCSKHRYIDDHKCPFDHVSFDREILKKNTIGIKADKLNRI